MISLCRGMVEALIILSKVGILFLGIFIYIFIRVVVGSVSNQ